GPHFRPRPPPALPFRHAPAHARAKVPGSAERAQGDAQNSASAAAEICCRIATARLRGLLCSTVPGAGFERGPDLTDGAYALGQEKTCTVVRADALNYDGQVPHQRRYKFANRAWLFRRRPWPRGLLETAISVALLAWARNLLKRAYESVVLCRWKYGLSVVLELRRVVPVLRITCGAHERATEPLPHRLLTDSIHSAHPPNPKPRLILRCRTRLTTLDLLHRSSLSRCFSLHHIAVMLPSSRSNRV
ncbi:MAG: hypothetical protein BJ554DRAFT_6298, partial [Olpidium bornovanus]